MLFFERKFCADVGSIVRALDSTSLRQDAIDCLGRAWEVRTAGDALNTFREFKKVLDLSKVNPNLSEAERKNLHTYSDRLGVLLEKEEARITDLSKEVLSHGKRGAIDEPSDLLEAPCRKGRRTNEFGVDVNKAEGEKTERKRPAESSPPNEPPSKRLKTDTRLTDLPSPAIQEIVGYLPSQSKKFLLEVALHSREAGAMREGLFFDTAIPLLHVMSEIEHDPEVQQLYTKVYGKPLVITPNFLQERARAMQAKDADRVHQLNEELLKVKEIERDWKALPREVKKIFGNFDCFETSTNPQSLKLALSAIRAYNLACVGGVRAFQLAFDVATIKRQDLIDRGEEVAQRLEKAKESITILNLNREHLTRLPLEICTLRNLIVLCLTGNNLAILPPEIGNLVKLRSLYLASNNLTSIPSEIAALKELRLLLVRENHLTVLPNLGSDVRVDDRELQTQRR